MAPWGEPHFVADCHPCTFPIRAGGAEAVFTFEVRKSAEGHKVQAIDMLLEGSKQRLPVENMAPVASDEPFFFGGVDLNFDGAADLMLITSSGAANAYAAYWLFDTSAGRYRWLGTYPVFQLDPKSHHLKTYERGGDGGMIHEAKEYGFEGGELLLLRDEREKATGQPGVFKQIIREREKGVMKTVSERTVHGKTDE